MDEEIVYFFNFFMANFTVNNASIFTRCMKLALYEVYKTVQECTNKAYSKELGLVITF